MLEVKRRSNLLPPDHTKRERALADVDARLDDIDPSLISRAKSPAAAPAAYLPYLGWERSVDVYDPAWPEAVKRAVVEAAPTVHRYKGTRFAVEAALAALQVDATITEWWEQAPRGAPYTFSVTAYARAHLYDGPVLDTRLVRAVYSVVERTKPHSRAFDLTVVAGARAGLALTAATVVRARVRAVLNPEARESFAVGVGLAAAHVVRGRINLVLNARLDP